MIGSKVDSKSSNTAWADTSYCIAVTLITVWWTRNDTWSLSNSITINTLSTMTINITSHTVLNITNDAKIINKLIIFSTVRTIICYITWQTIGYITTDTSIFLGQTKQIKAFWTYIIIRTWGAICYSAWSGFTCVVCQVEVCWCT